MEPRNVLNDVRIASPCPVSWSTLRGDDRMRFCGLCSKHVYNLSGLTSAEAAGLIETAEGSLCVRLYRRRDGTVLTADCPVGLRYAVRRRLLKLATAGVISVATMWAGVWVYARGLDRPGLPPIPTGPGVTLTDWTDWTARALGFRWPWARDRALMGAICITPPSSPDPIDPATITAFPESPAVPPPDAP